MLGFGGVAADAAASASVVCCVHCDGAGHFCRGCIEAVEPRSRILPCPTRVRSTHAMMPTV
ncbi:MAG: hypothetical protein KF871_06050 [Hydrogenophaga sp.]|nr:hypothetical protein [Hydrogenophaga sp.]